MGTSELGIIDQLLFDIGQYIAGVFNTLAQNIQTAFTGILNGINNMISTITNALQRTVDSLASIIGDIFGKIEEFITTTVNQIVAFIDNILSDIIAGIRGLIDDATQYLKELTGQIVNFIEGLIDSATEFLSDLFDKVVSAIMGIVDKTKALFTDIFDKVVTEIQSIVDRVKLFFSDIFDLVATGINTVITSAGEVVRSITRAIEDFIASVVDVVGQSLRDLLETIANLPDTINALAETILQSAKSNIADPLTALPMGLINSVIEKITGAPLEDADRLQIETLNIVFGSSPVAQTPEQLRDIIQKVIPGSPVAKVLVTLLLAIIIIPMALLGIAKANSEIILQEHALENPYRLMDPPDIVSALHFGLIDQDQAVNWLRKTGYTESVGQMMLTVGELVPPEAEQLNWWLREFIDDSQLDKGLTKKGWRSDSIAQLKKAAFFIPPVQDLITMAVREVFTPDIAARFGQFQDFPDDFIKWAKQQGISEEWARNYWGAHWALPSVQMGFEMLHRDVITEEDLSLLLRASDVMPFWRDKLIEISFSPLTRVDIRRMHKVGVLTIGEVKRAYKDIGYNEANAQRLTDFTVELNAPKTVENDGDLTQLTRSNIIGLFKDGVFVKRQAQELLEGIGLSAASAALFIQSAEMEIQRQARKDEIKIVLDQADFGTITFEEAQDSLNALGLETAEITLALTELQKQQARRNKLPSKGDLDKMIKKGIIQQAEYLETLQRLGYSKKWADRLLQLTRG